MPINITSPANQPEGFAQRRQGCLAHGARMGLGAWRFPRLGKDQQAWNWPLKT
jgi:hypothetical protein